MLLDPIEHQSNIPETLPETLQETLQETLPETLQETLPEPLPTIRIPCIDRLKRRAKRFGLWVLLLYIVNEINFKQILRIV